MLPRPAQFPGHVESEQEKNNRMLGIGTPDATETPASVPPTYVFGIPTKTRTDPVAIIATLFAEETSTVLASLDLSVPVPTLTPIPTFTSTRTPPPLQRALELVESGNGYLVVGETDRAIRTFNQAIRISPELDTAYLGRAYAFENLGLYEAALNNYDKVIELTDDNSLIYYQRASVLWILGRHKQALNDLESTKKIDPEYLNAYNQSALTNVALGNLDQALTDANVAVESTLDPIDVAYFKDTRAFVYLSQGEYEKARIEYLSIGYRDVNIAPYIDLGLGIAYVNLGEIDAAEESIVKGFGEVGDEHRDPDPQLTDLIAMAEHALNNFSSPSATPTRTRTPRPSPSPTRTSTRTPTPTAILDSSFGPINSVLKHDPEANTIKAYRTGVQVSNMVVDATFTNPYSSQVGEWDYGFIIRNTSPGNFDVVTVSSRGKWSHWIRRNGDSDSDEYLGSGLVDLDLSTRGSNSIKVVALDGRGWLFVNDEFVENLKLDESDNRGGVSVVTGATNGHEVEGESTRFNDFAIKELILHHGPEDGRLVGQDGFISTILAGVNVGDSIVEARFFNPYPTSDGSWSYGFLIKSRGSNTFEAVFASSGKRWYHIDRNGTADSSITLDTGNLPYNSNLDTGVRGSNRILLMAFGEKGWLFVNDVSVGSLRLNPDSEKGDVAAISSYFNSDEKPGSITRFEEFTVWSP